MATYYVSPTGSNTAPYDTWAKAAKLPSTVISAGNSATGPHTLYIAPGTYANSMGLTNANWDSGTVIGTDGVNSTNKNTLGSVIINSAGLNAYTTQTSKTINYNNIVLMGADDGRYNAYITAGNSIFNNVIFRDGGTAWGVTGGYPVFNKCSAYGHTNTAYGGYISGGSPTFNYLIFRNNAGSFGATGGTTITVNNAVFTANKREAVRAVTGTQVVNMNNCVFSGCGYTKVMQRVFTADTTASINVNNSLILGPPFAPKNIYTENTTLTNCITKSPIVVSNNSKGFVAFCVDDSNNIDVFLELANYANALGIPATFALNCASAREVTYESLIPITAKNPAIPYSSSGSVLNEVSSHTYNHYDLTTLTPSELEYELTASKASIQANIPGYTCKTLVYPGGVNNATVQSATLSAGYILGRAVSSDDNKISSINLFNVDTYSAKEIIESPTGDSDLISALEGVAECGGCIIILAHGGESLDPPVSDAEYIILCKHILDIVADEVNRANILAVTLAQMAENINGTQTGYLTGTASTSDHITYTRTLTFSPDYHLRASSPCINAGTPISGLTTDYAGNSNGTLFGFNPDIGAYDTYQNTAKKGTMLAEFVIPAGNTAAKIGLITCTNSTDSLLYYDNGYVKAYDGTNTASVNVSSLSAGAHMFCLKWNDSTMKMSVGYYDATNDSIMWGTESTFAGYWPWHDNKLRVFYAGGNFPIWIIGLSWFNLVASDTDIIYAAKEALA